MTTMVRALALGLLLAGAAPVLAQMPPPPPGSAPMVGMPGPDGAMGGRMGHGPHGMMMGKRMFGDMSEAGRASMMEAMKAGADKGSHEQVKAARERMLAVLDTDRLDMGALKRAMDDERMTANANRERVQAAMLGGFAKLSVADRKAFVADARAMKSRMEERMGAWRGKRGGPGGDMMPPPPPM